MSAIPPQALPGWVNAHTHIYSGLAPLGMPPPQAAPANFLEILDRVWWRLDRALDERTLRAAARYYVAEALLNGTTTVIDHHESPNLIEGSLDVIADACDELGMRAVVCFGATERNAGRDEAEAGLAECRRFVSANRRPLVRGVVGLHASFTVSDDTIREAGRLCRELGTVLHVHVAEDGADVHDARRRGYDGPLERLFALDALAPGSILAHGIHVDAAQVRRADARRLWWVQNPRSNEGNRVGYPAALRISRRVAIGTDGYPSDLRVEFAALERLAGAQPGADDDGAATPALTQRLAAGRELASERFGGDPLAGDRVELADPSAAAARVARVWVAGRLVVEHGRLVRGDLDAIRSEARVQAARLWQRMEAVA